MTFSSGLSEMRYNIAHNGRRLKVAMAQNGIFLRDLAATTYDGSGGGGGGAAEADATV